MKPRSEKSMELYRLMLKRGYPEPFCDEVTRNLNAYHRAADLNQALTADVGEAFFEKSEAINLYADDGCHPNMEGTKLTAQVIAETILKDWNDR